MRAMVLEEGAHRLQPTELPCPRPGPGEILLKVRACGVCRTDLHIVDGELVPSAWPVIPGHEVVGEVTSTGPGVARFNPGDAVGLAWLAPRHRPG